MQDRWELLRGLKEQLIAVTKAGYDGDDKEELKKLLAEAIENVTKPEPKEEEKKS